MFSLNYLSKSLVLLITHPSALLGWLRGHNPSIIIDEQRRAKWEFIKTKFASNPKKSTGFSIFLNPHDHTAVSSSIGTVGWLNLALTELFRKIVTSGMTFVDAGANIGYYTLLASSLVGENGQVFAFEPDPESFAFLAKSIQYNGFQNITAEQTALSDEEGLLRPNIEKIGVRTTTLNHLNNLVRIDVVKIHTNGSEPQVLCGARNLIQKHHPRIIVSYVQRLWREYDDLLEFLRIHYEIFVVRQSPILVRRVKSTDLKEWKAAELYLVPRNSGS